MDLLHIHELTAQTTIGIHEWEKAVLQKIILNTDLACDCGKIAQNDRIADAYDYDTISHNIVEFLARERTELIETLADKLAHYIHELTESKWIKINLIKPGAIKLAKRIAVTIERNFDN